MENPNRLHSGKSKNDSNDQILQKLPFRIIEVSSEEQNYPATELLNHTPFSRGWQSSRFPEYPQEIILEFPSTVRICQFQFLSHQYKITSKIEIFITNPNPNSVRQFKKIGHLSLDSNERSNFQARELKSVYIDYHTQKLKFSLHRCHTNVHNTYSQVGLIAINILGEYIDKSGDNVNMNNYIKNEVNKLEDEMNFDPATLKRLKILYKAKEKAVELEDFDEAKKIKEAIDRLKSVSSQLIQLEERKRIAVKNDDFDAAKMLKYEIERLRNAVSGLQLNDNYQDNHYNNDKFNQGFMNNPATGKTESGLQIRDNIVPINKKSKNDMPLTSDMVLEGEDMIYKTKNINPNEGYQLKRKEDLKKKVDVENMIIKGISRDFKDIVDEKINKEIIGPQDKFEKDETDDEIPAIEYKKAEPLIPILSFNLVKKIFSKNWKNKEEGLKILTGEIENYPNSDLLKPHTSDKILTATMGIAAYILSCNISQPLTASMNLLKILLNKFRGNNIQGYLRQDFDNSVDQSLLLLIEKVGDANLKLKEKAENTVMEFANSPLIGHKTVFEALIKGQVKKTLVKSARHLSGRLNLITRMINNFGLNTNEVPIDTLMNYTMSAYKDPNKEVRETAYNLILNIYKFIGPDVRNYYKDLRPAQINLLEEAFENIDGFNQEVPSDGIEENNEVVNDSKMLYNYDDGMDGRKNSANRATKSKKNINEYEREDNKNQSQNHSFNNTLNPTDESTTCRFCGFFDPNFDEDTLFMHFYKECPMLTSCFKCKQTIEISSLNYHYLNECNFKKDFKTCIRCKEAVFLGDYDRHVSEKACTPAKNPTISNRCPLCHSDFTPPGNVGWEVHLLQNTCPNNPRTNY